jgi:hypothetical protein
MSRFTVAALLLMSATSVYAEDELETLPVAVPAPVATTAVAPTATPITKPDTAALESMARQFAAQYRITAEKKAALAAIAAKQNKALAPQMQGLENAMKGFAQDPQLQAALQRLMQDMSGVLARQVPQMIAAVRPVLQEALPAILEAQAQALRIVSTPTPVDPYAGE